MRKLIVLAVLATTASVHAQETKLTPDQQAIQRAHDAYQDCARKNALRLERSGDAAADIATAAVWECRTAQMDVVVQGIIHGAKLSLDRMDRVDNDARSAAIAAVIEQRAAKHK